MSDPTIQSPTGPGAGATGTWNVSLAEIDAMGLKAARGAGLSWGLAQEAGRAARWLAAYRLPGPETLAALLEATAADLPAHEPSRAEGVWQGRSGSLCPVRLGAALSDHAHEFQDSTAIRTGAVLQPLLILPFLCRVARDCAMSLAISGAGFAVTATPEGPASADFEGLDRGAIDALTVMIVGTWDGELRRNGPDAHTISVDIWRSLEALAHHTYVPASDQSRLAGAGAGLDDND